MGASETIRELKPKVIQIEHNKYHLFQQRNMYDFSRILAGYNMYQLLPKNMGLAKRDPKDSLSNLYEYSNFLFINREVDRN
jgi:hypothetical protein